MKLINFTIQLLDSKPNRDAYKSLRPRSSAFNCDSLEEVFDEMKKLCDVRCVRLAEPKWRSMESTCQRSMRTPPSDEPQSGSTKTMAASEVFLTWNMPMIFVLRVSPPHGQQSLCLSLF
ncbi:hypothetical protein FCV25MIE_21598 [Fagus crenata]